VKVLELLSSPVWTGPAEPMASVAAHLRARGHEVEMAVDSRRPGDLREKLRGLGFTVREDLALSTRGFPPSVIGDAGRLARLGSEFDVVHAHFSNDHAAALLGLRSRRAGPRVVRTVHSSRSLEGRFLQGAAHRRTDGLVTVCEAHARVLRERFRVPEERILATRGAVDCERFRPEGPDLREELGLRPDQPVVGIVSRIKPGRGHAELLLAFRAVADAAPEARLVVVGRGEGTGELQYRVGVLGLARRVVFAGYRTGAALADAYRTLDACVLLAEGNDGTCRALLEAMACGRPGVAYRFGAPAETIVDGVTGALVEPGDIAGLANALVALSADRAQARALGGAARERMRAHYTEAARGEAVERFLAAVLALPPAVL
jgi:L-malate glycosyltransferase